MYEFDEELYTQMNLYSICARDILFNYIRAERGSGYVVRTSIKKINDKGKNRNHCQKNIQCRRS